MLGFITLLGMIVRNVILMYQHAEDKRKVCHWSGKLAAYDAGKRRMVPIFLTTATTAVGVVPMMLGGSTFWAPWVSRSSPEYRFVDLLVTFSRSFTRKS